MAWQEPKTDWKASDYVNIGDYNRITGNLTHLKGLAGQAFAAVRTPDLGAAKGYGDYIYADELNAIEAALDAICGGTYGYDIGSRRTYYDNQPTPDYAEFNRIESACLRIYKSLLGQIEGKQRLSFRLGGAKRI